MHILVPSNPAMGIDPKGSLTGGTCRRLFGAAHDVELQHDVSHVQTHQRGAKAKLWGGLHGARGTVRVPSSGQKKQ